MDRRDVNSESTQTNLKSNLLEAQMGYVLDTISPEDQDKIISEVNDTSICQTLSYVKKNNSFTENWVIDRGKNYYFFIAPDVVRTDRVGLKYHIFYKGQLYTLHINDWFGNKVYIEEREKMSKEFLSSLQDEIKLAFSVHGRSGSGPTNESGAPVNEVVPEFDWEMK